MAMHLDLDLPSQRKQGEQGHPVHYLPCTFSQGGTTDSMDAYFCPKLRSTSKQPDDEKQAATLEVSLRGRPLLGKVVSLPPHCIGFVLKQSDDDGTAQHQSKDGRNDDGDDGAKQQDSTEWKTEHSFVALTEWYWDQNPHNGASTRPSPLQWLHVSRAIHDPPSPSLPG